MLVELENWLLRLLRRAEKWLLRRRVPWERDARTQLEQAARVMGLFQGFLLEYSPPAPDAEALVQRLRAESCRRCSIRDRCRVRGRLDAAMVAGEEPFLCRKPELAMAELRQSRRAYRWLKASRAMQEEYRMALVQQYGFLADALHNMADRLEERRYTPRFRVQVSARSRGRERVDGDRVLAFPGGGCRFFVAVCDGMGTGKGAAAESTRTSGLIRQMLCAGFPPETVLGSVNNQLALVNRAGAVTVDLAEVRLDSGRVWLYKWGAGKSLLLRQSKAMPLGASGPPPGLGVGTDGENVTHAALDRQEVLLMLSDGVGMEYASRWAERAGEMTVGALAEQVLADGGSREDDATVVAIRLVPTGE